VRVACFAHEKRLLSTLMIGFVLKGESRGKAVLQ
jgi:hypothetical protein